MNELVNLVAQRTGLPADKAQTAVQAVIGFLKERLPAPISGELDRLVAGGAAAPAGGQAGELGELGNLAKGLGGMLGGQG